MRGLIAMVVLSALIGGGPVAAGPDVTPSAVYVDALKCASGKLGSHGTPLAASCEARNFSLFPDTGGARASRPPKSRHAPSAHPPGDPLADLRITFRYASADLTDHDKAQAASFASALQDPAVALIRVEIGGHTDASGDEARNQMLSQRRADAVKAYLVALGVDGSRLESRGYGSRDPAVPHSPLDPANRRVGARPLG